MGFHAATISQGMPAHDSCCQELQASRQAQVQFRFCSFVCVGHRRMHLGKRGRRCEGSACRTLFKAAALVFRAFHYFAGRPWWPEGAEFRTRFPGFGFKVWVWARRLWRRYAPVGLSASTVFRSTVGRGFRGFGHLRCRCVAD